MQKKKKKQINLLTIKGFWEALCIKKNGNMSEIME